MLPNFKHSSLSKPEGKSIRRQGEKRIEHKWNKRKIEGPSIMNALKNKMK